MDVGEFEIVYFSDVMSTVKYSLPVIGGLTCQRVFLLPLPPPIIWWKVKISQKCYVELRTHYSSYFDLYEF